MRQIASFIAVAAIAMIVVSCGNSEPKLIPSQVGSKWGYVNPKGKLVVEPSFDAAEAFSCQMAKIVIKGKVGYIGADGQVKIPADYLEGTSFFEDMAYVVAPGEAPRCIDKTGRVLFNLPDEIQTAFAFSKGVSKVITHGGAVRFVDKVGNAAATPSVYQVSDTPGYSSIKSDAYYAPELLTSLHSSYGEYYDMGFSASSTLGDVRARYSITQGPSDVKVTYKPDASIPINGVTLENIQFSFDGPVMGTAGGGAARGGFGKYKTATVRSYVSSRRLKTVEYHFKMAEPSKGAAFARSLAKELAAKTGDPIGEFGYSYSVPMTAAHPGYTANWTGADAVLKLVFTE